MQASKKIFVFLTLLFCSTVFAQEDFSAKIDSLVSALPKLKDTAYVNAMNKLSSWNLPNSISNSRIYANKALEKSQALNYIKGEGMAWYNLGKYYNKDSNYDSALYCFIKSQTLFESQPNLNQTELCKTLGSIGQAYYFQGKYDKAIAHFFKALKLAEKLNDYALIAQNYNSLGNSNYFQSNNKIALEYYSQATRYWMLAKNELRAAGTLDNIGLIYCKLGRYEEALVNQKKALEIEKRYNNLSEIASTLSNIGNTFHQMERNQEALKYHLESHEIRLKLNDKRKLAYSFYILGSSYIEVKDSKKAIDFTLQGIELSKKIGLNQYVCEGYQNLASMYGIAGDYKNAFHYQKLFSSINDSLYSIEKSQQINELQANFELEKKQQSIELLKKDSTIKNLQLSRNKNWLITLSFIILGVLAITGLLYNRFRVKKKANQLLSLQNIQINNQKKEITDSINYALLIQQSIMSSQEDIQKIFPNHFIFYKPKDIVSGDFYWAGEKNGVKYVAAVDCTGHGVPGAMMSVIGHNLLNQALYDKSIREPNEILNFLDHGVVETLHQNKDGSIKNGMDLSLCAIDSSNRIVSFSGAVNPVYLFSEGNLNVLKADKLYIGSGNPSGDEKRFSLQQVAYKPGDCIYLFTDGYIDQFGKSGKKLMSKGFKNQLHKIQGMSMQRQNEELHSFLQDWKANEEQTDDVLVIGIQL